MEVARRLAFGSCSFASQQCGVLCRFGMGDGIAHQLNNMADL
jgi:hypothetical protein